MALVLVLVVGTAEMLTLSLKAKRRGDVLAAITHAVSDRLDGLRARPNEDAALAAGTYAETVRVDPGGCLIAQTWEIAESADGLKRIRLTAREAGARLRVPRQPDLRAPHVQGEVDAVSSGWGTCGPEGGEAAGG